MIVTLSELLKNYNKDMHAERINAATHMASFDLQSFSFMQDYTWVEGIDPKKIGNLPAKTASLIIDSYYHLPQRPDMAFLYLWMAFNSTFHQTALVSACRPPQKNNITDDLGIDAACQAISGRLHEVFRFKSTYRSLESFLEVFLKNVPEKLCSMIATTFVKSEAIRLAGLSRRYQSKSIDSLEKNFPEIKLALSESYGMAYHAIATPVENISLGVVDFNIADKSKAQLIIRSLSLQIKNLMSSGMLCVRKHGSGLSVSESISNFSGRIEFFVRFILYASRNNMSHGKVSSRLNSNTASKESYDSNLFIYVACYVLLSVLLFHMGFASRHVVNDALANMSLIQLEHKLSNL